MTNAPEKINASLTATRNGWYQIVNVKSGQRAFPITSYTRTDVADARIEELEAALLECREEIEGLHQDAAGASL